MRCLAVASLAVFVLGCGYKVPAASGPMTGAVPTPAATQGDPRFDPPYLPVPPGVAEPPRFKPSGQGDETLPITTNAYGAFVGAPKAPQLGARAEDFRVALAGGGTFDLAEARAAGPVLLMFYRGFW